MSDTLTKGQRRRAMQAVGQKDTEPELIVRRLLHRLGYRYRLHGKALPGKPDIVFAGRRKEILSMGASGMPTIVVTVVLPSRDWTIGSPSWSGTKNGILKIAKDLPQMAGQSIQFGNAKRATWTNSQATSAHSLAGSGTPASPRRVVIPERGVRSARASTHRNRLRFRCDKSS